MIVSELIKELQALKNQDANVIMALGGSYENVAPLESVSDDNDWEFNIDDARIEDADDSDRSGDGETCIVLWWE